MYYKDQTDFQNYQGHFCNLLQLSCKLNWKYTLFMILFEGNESVHDKC